VDLIAYVEKHEFCFDVVLNENITNDEVVTFEMVKMRRRGELNWLVKNLGYL